MADVLVVIKKRKDLDANKTRRLMFTPHSEMKDILL